MLDHVKKGSVFEFGCGNGKLARMLLERPDIFRVCAIDLDKRKVGDNPPFEFIEGDLVGSQIDSYFDNIVALCSFEHVGLEFFDIKTKDNIKWDYPKLAADHLKNLLIVGGRLILTVPYFMDKDKTFLLDSDHKYKSVSEAKSPIGGYRTHSLVSYQNLFLPLKLKQHNFFYQKRSDSLYDHKAWSEITQEKANKYDDVNNDRLILGMIYE